MTDDRPLPGLGDARPAGEPVAQPTDDRTRPRPIQRRRIRPPEPVSEEDGYCGLPAGKVLLGGLLGLVVAILLNSQALLRDAEQKPFGRSRDVSVAIWEPVEGVASAIGLTAPRRWVDEALSRDVSDELFQLETVAGPSDATTPSTSNGVQQIDVSGGIVTSDADESVGADGASASTTAAPLAIAPGVPTSEDPLHLWIVGDSMVQFFGDTMAALANDTGVVDATAESKLSSGLSRPDFFDWPARLSELLADEDPDALVIMYGGNDAQGLVTPDGVAQPFSDLWVAEYSSRVGALMDLVTADSVRQVLWVGQPIMRSGDFDAKMQELNTIYAAEAAKRERVTFVETRALFQTAAGGYDRYLPNDDGEIVDVRLSDGIHLSTAGGRWLSELLLESLGELVDLESGRSPS
ncbi:MAG: DUF459 domain-containing protein [Actinomycetota bacterium]|jgi:uncharacterized protein|nr:DUF459 domain-containing protein [Actinomycetota bacterium]